MTTQHRRKQIELSGIFLCASFLLVALPPLAARFTAEARAVSAPAPADPYPDLYALGAELLPLEAGEEGEAEQKIVYLTFDDGPSPNTERLLEILAEHGARATFFVTSQEWEGEYLAGMYGRIVEEGHTLGLHSYSHNFRRIYASPHAYLSDIDRLREFVEESCGYRPSILRFPGGSTTSHASPQTIRVLTEELVRRGYRWYDWDVSVGDDTTALRRPQAIARTIIRGVEAEDGKKKIEGATIILCHDSNTPTTTPDAIALVLEELIPKGYEFRALPSHHFAAPKE